MVQRNVPRIGAIVVFATLLVGCGTAATNNNAGGANSAGNSSAASSQPVVTPTAAAGDATKGQTLFTQNCAACHSTGTDTKVGPGLKGLFSKSALPNGKPVNEKNIEEWISTGGGPMPSFPQLSDSDRANLAAYIKTLS